MNILLINYEYPPIGGGAANATFHMGRCLTDYGHSVTVLTSRFKKLAGYRMEDGICVYRVLALRRYDSLSNTLEMFSYLVSASFALRKILKKHNINVTLVFFSFPCGPLGLLGKIMCGIPYVISLRGGDVPGTEKSLKIIHKIFQPLRRLIFRHSKAVIANSEGLRKLAETADPFPVKVIPNGVDVEFFTPPETRIKNSSSIKLLFAGRFQKQKNLFFLLDEMNILAREIQKAFELHIVGNGPLEEPLKKHANTMEIRGKVFWHNWCSKDELKKKYQEADCLVNPSLYEGMPNVVLEAMACALPVVASRVAGNESVVKHGETGLLFELNRPEEFRQAVATIIMEIEQGFRMGRKGRTWVENQFSWNRMAQEYIQLFE